MRVSINFADGKASATSSRIARLYLEPEELPGVKAVRFDGTLSGGLTVEDDGNPRRLHNYAVLDRGDIGAFTYRRIGSALSRTGAAASRN